MRLIDALFYWLQLKWMTNSRPDDEAARDSLLFFAQILSEDHELTSFEIDNEDRGKIYVTYASPAEPDGKTVWFDREAVEQLHNDLHGTQARPDEDDDDSEVT
ncbi:hypothetical protein [Cohnella nanjingensis]|uniref:Uncharacterized protein n=1 Tax=Cohnella nanjingensis TaxID=1387779 RepID=A0A7X0RXP6_9BACL|nr:hypothetical protein [Cohnella nanjingensis]MBB6675584.1 hypothetical protein [Cohnella nanjingensis]